MNVVRYVFTVLLATSGLVSQAREIGFIEQFALAVDRSEALKQLVPGTEDYYYFHCLHLQQREQFEQVDELLQKWIARYNYTPRVREIRNRQALLTYDEHPLATLEHLRKELDLRFDHRRESIDDLPPLPTTLDPELISVDRFKREAFRQAQNLNKFEDSALDWLIAEPLRPEHRRDLLKRLTRPDYPNLARLIIDDLKYKHSGGFGQFKIHSQLLLPQLDECLRLAPDLLNQQAFVNTYISKLHPNADVDWRHDAAALEAYFDRLWQFVRRLAPSHNSLKTHVLYHRLAFDRSRGIFDEERFLEYVKLPRNVGYINPRYLQVSRNRANAANLSANFQPVTLLPPVRSDTELVRDYLQHFFVDRADYRTYAPYMSDTFLKHLFAETKIVNGLGEPERWASLLPPQMFKQLGDRIDIDFAPTNATVFRSDQAVQLDLDIKNVNRLMVKVYEINTKNYYERFQREVNTDINLDGLVANHEITHEYSEAPFRRVRRHFEFPKLSKPGVYVIDFLGNGKNSRAVIRKGKLRIYRAIECRGSRGGSV